MADVGDRIETTSKAAPRAGVVTGISGAMITVRWDTGDETTLVPGPGVLRVTERAVPAKKAGGNKKKQ
jgi:hypothetical protein